MDAMWVRSIRAQCRAAGVAFFFKQWGGARKSEKGRLLDGRIYSEFPDRVQIAPPTVNIRREKLERWKAESVQQRITVRRTFPTATWLRPIRSRPRVEFSPRFY
jgi:hypothetical protein